MKKVVVIGPESTGKSTLAESLAQEFNTYWVKEYAREYLLKHGTDYTFDDLLTIAKGQLREEEEVVLRAGKDGKKIVFIDTDMYVMKVWSEFVFGSCDPFILRQIASRKYDLYLLCNTDLPWVKDELREYPDLETREKLFHIYKDLMVNQQVPWIEIKGNYDERLSLAKKTVQQLLQTV